MSATSGLLNVRRVRDTVAPGRYGDGGGLYLSIAPGGSKQWLLRLTVHGRRRDIGLGGVDTAQGGVGTVKLEEARQKAREMRRIARAGGDPLAERNRSAGIPTFEEAARKVHTELIEPTAKNVKHRQQWINTLQAYAFPRIGNRRVDVIQSGDILRVLLPIWLEKPETARRVRQRLRTVFDWSIANEYREASNPLAGIEKALPKQGDKAKHHAALPYAELPGMMERLENAEGIGALAVRFAILTATRSGEVRGARWQEIDAEACLWTVPGERMKAGEPHRVPLSDAALAVLEKVRGLDDGLVFPGMRRGSALSDMSLTAVLKRLNVPVTVHGFRSTFRDWAEERTAFSHEVKEAALAHTIRNKVEAAYRRGDHIEQRRKLMDTWARFATSQPGTVVTLSAGGQ
jgi:integrase